MGCCQAVNTEIESKQRASVHALTHIYEFDSKVLGAGSFGKVFLGHNKIHREHQVAVKVISKMKFEHELDFIRQEVRILRTLDHPNIVKYYETYEDSKYLYLVMEYCPGGELLDKITKSYFSEKSATAIMRDILRAINHCHCLNIAHRDIKPENLMYDADGNIKLIDFGLAKQSEGSKEKMTTLAGTPYFISPEILNGVYGKQCDIWSLGILLYLLLSGSFPFDGTNRAQVFDKIQNENVQFEKAAWKTISLEGKDLIMQMLEKKPKRRITAAKALKHPWFQLIDKEEDLNSSILSKGVVERLRQFKGQSKFKKAAMNILVKMINPRELEDLRKEFQKIDSDNSGMIELKELEKALSKYNIPHEEIKQIIEEIDYDDNQQINYSEFIAATISVNQILTHEKLEALFNQFDQEQRKEITPENIVKTLKAAGRDITLQELQEIMLRHDKSNDGLIQFEEFRQMLLGDHKPEDDSGQLRMTTSKASPRTKSPPRYPAGS